MVTITSIGSALAGTTFTLNCTLTLLQSLNGNNLIVWANSNGQTIQNGSIPDVTISPPTPHSRTLTFSPLHTNYGGIFWCIAFVDVVEAALSVNNTSLFNITVQSKSKIV